MATNAEALFAKVTAHMEAHETLLEAVEEYTSSPLNQAAIERLKAAIARSTQAISDIEQL